MLRVLHNTNIDFIRLWRVSTAFSVLLIVPGLIWILVSGFHYSIEFTGGTLKRIQFRDPAPSVADVRAALATGGLPQVEIQTFGGPNDLIMRAQDSRTVAQQDAGAEVVSRQIVAALDAKFGREAYTVLRTEGVGPKVGSELRRNAMIALAIAFLTSLIYLAWRFEWRFGLAAVLATIHDILATLAFMKYMNIEISLFVVGALLTVIGYSLNDTVVVFDRVRENLKKFPKTGLYDLLNRSVNETLPRTVLTGSTTLATLLSLIIFGGTVIRPFAWVLLWGIIVGTFSSVYVASPLLLWINHKWPRESATTGRADRLAQASRKSERDARPAPAR
ncbi:MAG TPA: protein translocase subunit SecF [Gemmatimonadaceae bacterium]|nr:protein translocase subunit SecF [Gemmatimonadaceae bacterium]